MKPSSAIALVSSMPGAAAPLAFFFSQPVTNAVAKVLVVEDAVLVDDEGRDAGVAVLLGVSDEGEASGHLSVDDVIFRAAFGIGALFREHAIEVPVKWLLLSCLRVESFCGSKRY